MTHINPDDPKWTAYIMNELDDNERAAIESELESSDEARSLVEELKLAVDLTRVDLRHEVPIVPLTSQQRETIQASANVVRPRLWFGARPAVWVTGLAAATIALAIGLAVNTTRFQPARPFNGVIARNADQTKQQIETAATAVIEETKQAPEFGFRYEHPAPAVTTAPVASKLKAEVQAAAPAPAAMPAPPPPAAVSPLPQVPPTGAADEKLASTVTARVFGRVQDASGAVIPGVTIVATNTQTGAAATAVTNESGAYKLDGLQPGPYNVTGALPGFQTSVDKVELAASVQAERDIKLQVAQTA
jgi:hypothetical protein